MKKLIIGALLFISTIAIAALSSPKVGGIDYAEGVITIGREGKVISAPNIGDPILSGDFIKTQGDGTLIIAMDKNTGMNGKITVRPRSSLYINLDAVKGEPRTRIQILTGAIGSKVSKLTGNSPSVTVTSSSAVMAVRGTEYEVAVSINADDASANSQQAILVTCTESKVAVNDGTGEVEVNAGKVLEKRPGERLRFLPVAVSSVKGFSQKWIADEIAAFRADAPRALADYAARYTDLSAKFSAAYDPFQRSPTAKKWAEEDRAGAKINPLNPAVMREKKELAGYLLNIRKILFVFERVYYRVDEISDAIAGTADERREIRPGQTAGDFIQSVRAERDKLAAQVARYRYIEELFRQRDTDGEAFSSEDDFFASPDGF
jgi:FecR protein